MQCIQLAAWRVRVELVLLLIRGMSHSHCNKSPEFASSTSWNGASTVEGIASDSGADGLGKRFGNSFAQFETEDLEIRAILDDARSI
jgi:hypothetical protein